MSEFRTPLRVEKIVDSNDQWKVLEDFIYASDLGGLITVPAGFITDFASTPQLVWNIFPKDGRWDGAALVHDYLYNTHKFVRSECDGIFLEALKILNVPWYQSYPMYWAVRSCGWLFYGKNPASAPPSQPQP